MSKIIFRLLAAVLLLAAFSSLSVAAEQEARAKIDISGHPFLGPVNAPVTLVVFSDYL